MSADPRPLPNFLIAGFPKAGTSALASYLDSHTDICVAPEKEVNFFDTHFGEGVDWYRSRFHNWTGQRAVGDATPVYVLQEEYLDRISATVPDVRLIISLRDPLARAYSQYWYARSLGFERASFRAVVDNELAGRRRTPFRYVASGRYVEHLRHVAARFPPEQIHVMLFEDLVQDPIAVLRDVYGFLEVDESWVAPRAGEVVNRTTMLRSGRLRVLMLRLHLWRRAPRLADALDRWNRVERAYPPMPDDLRTLLIAHYEDANAALSRWLGRSLDVWPSVAQGTGPSTNGTS